MVLGFGVRFNVVVMIFFEVKIIEWDDELKLGVIVEIVIVVGGKFVIEKFLLLFVIVLLIGRLLMLVIDIIVLVIVLFVILLMIWLCIVFGFGVRGIVSVVIWLVVIIVLIVVVLKFGVKMVNWYDLGGKLLIKKELLDCVINVWSNRLFWLNIWSWILGFVIVFFWILIIFSEIVFIRGDKVIFVCVIWLLIMIVLMVLRVKLVVDLVIV